MLQRKMIFLFFVYVLMLTGCEANLSYDEYIQRAQQYSNQGENEKAIETYKKALQIKPDDSCVHYALGCLYFKELLKLNRAPFSRKEADELREHQNELSGLATSEFKKTLEQDPGNWFARYMVATDHYNKKRYNEAIKEYIAAIKYNQKYATAYSMLASSYSAIGKYELAIKNINEAYRLDKDTEQYYYHLGKIYYKIGDYNKGFEMQTKLKKLNSRYYNDLVDYRYSDKKDN